MAPAGRMGAADHDVIEQQLKETIQSLYQILVQVSAYDQHTSNPSAAVGTPAGSAANSTANANAGSNSGATAAGAAPTSKPSAEVLSQEMRTLSESLQQIHLTASTPDPAHSLPHIPPELVQYVENGRNPDIYTREFVEQVRRGNQLLRGKQVAFGRFRDVLAGEMDKALPELHDDIAAVLDATGGRNRWSSSSSPTSGVRPGAGAGESSSSVPPASAAAGGGGGGSSSSSSLAAAAPAAGAVGAGMAASSSLGAAPPSANLPARPPPS